MKWVTISTERNEAEAYLVKGFLENNDVPTVVAPQTEIGIKDLNPYTGLHRVSVPEDKVAIARELLASRPNAPKLSAIGSRSQRRGISIFWFIMASLLIIYLFNNRF